jgi:hypothetical protein
MVEGRILTVTLETVTPMFLGGADPRGTPELRVPSVRGGDAVLVAGADPAKV